MTQVEAVKVVAILSAAYPNWAASKETVALYVEMLEDLEIALVMPAVKDLISTEDWCPPISVIRRHVGARMGLLSPSPLEAWGEVLSRITEVGLMGNRQGWSHEAVDQTVRAIGWGQLCRSTNVDTVRAHFLRLYADSASTLDKEATRVLGRAGLESKKAYELE
jgi:Loader and inhibitor of phage G40P